MKTGICFRVGWDVLIWVGELINFSSLPVSKFSCYVFTKYSDVSCTIFLRETIALLCHVYWSPVDLVSIINKSMDRVYDIFGVLSYS